MPPAIRRAVFDREKFEETNWQDGGPDADLILSYLQALPLPGHPDLQSIGNCIEGENEVVMIDDEHQTVARLCVMPVAREVIIPWWLPRAHWTENNMADLVPVMGAACDEVLSFCETVCHVDASSWPLYGDFQGAGSTDAERKANSDDIAEAWADFFGPEVGVTDTPSNPTRMGRAHSTVGAIANLARGAP